MTSTIGQPGDSVADETYTVVRTFNAPLSKLWEAYSDLEALKQWWGPKGFKMIKASLDFRPGGSFHYGMEGPNGYTMYGIFKYHNIKPMELIEFVVSFSDENGGLTRHPMAPNWPLEVLSRLTFSEEHGKTVLHMESMPYNASEEERKTFLAGHESMNQGWKGTLEQLEAFLAQ